MYGGYINGAVPLSSKEPVMWESFIVGFVNGGAIVGLLAWFFTWLHFTQ